MATPVLVGIAGFRGYSGAELERLLTRHRFAIPYRMEHRQDAGHRPEPVGLRQPESIACTAEAAREAGLRLVFLATPADVSLDLTAGFLEAGIKVVDLSAAFRLGTVENFNNWYNEEHRYPQLISEAVYGLPEFYRSRIPGSRLVANPGCYPTAANLAIRPLIDANIVNRSAGIVCDAKSGVSGAGRKPTLKTSFCEVYENFSAYSILGHRHVPEVLFNSGLEEGEFSFTAQLLPVNRGILETIYLRTTGVSSAEQLFDIYQKRYAGERFVRMYKPGNVPDLFSVNHTNFCDIGFKFDPKHGRLVVVVAIDNLVKGAAGQAVQNFNLLMEFDEAEGLL
jgi:N-acetyl-gamma-glutamyl-phosphate reductase